jgi:glycosyltransferase involved in cell wall biosynthesis
MVTMADPAAPGGPAPVPATTISVVIPVHNEEAILVDTVGHVMTGLSAMPIDSFEIILCENGSSDTTSVIADALTQQHPEVKLLTLDRADYGAAMKAGFLAAKGEIIVNFDADYYDLEFLSAALSTDADIVVAAKGILGSHDTRVFIRRVASRTFGWFVRRMVNVKVAETHGMKLMHRAAVIGLVGQVRSTKDLFDTELLVRAERSGLRIRELPITTEELRHSRSGILRRIPRTIWGLVKMRMLLRRHRSIAPAQVEEAAND